MIRPDMWEVIVGNIGTVYRGPNPVMARLEYNVYVAKAKGTGSRVSGESVDLWKNGEPVASTPATLGSIEEEEEGVNGNWEVYPCPACSGYTPDLGKCTCKRGTARKS